MSASYFPPIISSIYLEELAGQATDAKDSALVALNAAEAARDTALNYRNEAQTYYTQVQQIQEGDYVTNLSLEERLSVINFADLQGIPATFAPSAHGHSWSEIANKPTMYPPTAHGHTWNEITGKPTEFEPLPHVHTWQQIAQKPGTFPPETHFHSWSEIENKPSVFNPAAHTHSWGDISGKPTKFEPAAHTHTWDLIENKPLTFPPQSHHHHWSQVTSKPEQATRWPHFSEVTNKPEQATRWPTFSEVTGKPEQATRWPTYSEISDKPALGTAASHNVTSDYLGGVAGQLFKKGDLLMGVEDALQGIDAPDLNALHTGGTHYVFGPINGATSVTSFVRVLPGKTPGRTVQFQIPVNGNEIYWRSQSNHTWSAWRSFYHGGNFNPREFNAQPGGVMAEGVNASSGIAVFYLNPQMQSRPGSVSVSGTYRIRTPISNTIIAEGVTPAFNTSNSTGSKIVLTCNVAGLAAQGGTQKLELVAETQCKITANS